MTDSTVTSVLKNGVSLVVAFNNIMAAAANLIWSSQTALIAAVTTIVNGLVNNIPAAWELYNQIENGTELTQAQVDAYLAAYTTQHEATIAALDAAISAKAS